jgi:hypothetical protein
MPIASAPPLVIRCAVFGNMRLRTPLLLRMLRHPAAGIQTQAGPTPIPSRLKDAGENRPP